MLNHEALAAELQVLRTHVSGVTYAVIAAADGIPIVADGAQTVGPDCVAALAAAGLGLARRTTEVIGQGRLRQSVVHSSGGYMAVYAIEPMALMVVLGDQSLNIGVLHQEAQPVVERAAVILAAS
jgi:predicted regulator of Ras-like GTPase activity (Roadblock/LC7/MglB family)